MRSRSFAWLFALLTTSGVLLAADGCTIINGLSVPVDGGPSQSPVDASDGARDSGDGCNHATAPPRPTTADTTVDQTLVAVAKQILLSTPSGAVAVGYDLDDTCTTDKATETCVSNKPHPDPPNGIDNNAGELFNVVNTQTDIEQRVNSGILVGRNTFLVRISGYNGTPNDPSVVVSLYASPGLLDGSGQPKPPQFVETEAWSLDDAQFTALSPDLPTTTTQGYVAGGVVVAYLATSSIMLSDTFAVKLSGSLLTIDLDLTGTKPVVRSGVIAGRWSASDILRVVARQRTSDGGKALCDDPLDYAFAKSLVCGEVDIAADPLSDRKGVACDATSASVRFVAAPASLGPKRKGSPDEPCPTFPADSCGGDGG